MSAIDMWSVCDTCGCNYARRDMHKSSYNTIVCRFCWDGDFDLHNHPQNKSAPLYKEPTVVPDGRPDQIVAAGPFWTINLNTPLGLRF